MIAAVPPKETPPDARIDEKIGERIALAGIPDLSRPHETFEVPNFLCSKFRLIVAGWQKAFRSDPGRRVALRGPHEIPDLWPFFLWRSRCRGSFVRDTIFLSNTMNGKKPIEGERSPPDQFWMWFHDGLIARRDQALPDHAAGG
ncbi:hypothetical protein [Methylobacterium sp. AMS5]|uniref:hypothetical protein n=1 Tax=Methylobacterium sp. AMS5 TaxID=925818 RepID=UPI000A7DC593|nr:hypothetical protein [Methylobacterium sp. AMS5]